MTYLPNVREEIEKPLFVGTKGSFEPRPNAYWEGNLDRDGKLEVSGYDWCVEQVKNFFANYPKHKKTQEHLAEWLEMERTELVVSLIESMPEDETCE